MRRIGTISSAIGFIFLGVWMIISNGNPELGGQIFKWWPVIIIILGLEVLLGINIDKTDGKKAKINPLIFLVIIIFIIVNAFQGVAYYFGGFTGRDFSFDKLIRWGQNFDVNNYKEIKTSRELDAYGKKFVFESDNGVIKFIKSNDGKIKIDAKVYVDKGAPRDSYNIREAKGIDGYRVAMKEDYIRRVNVDIYIPDGYNIGVETENSSINTSDSFPESNFNIKTSNGNVELDGGQSLTLEIDSGIIKVNEIKDVKIKGSSGTVAVNGDTQNLDVMLDSGTFNLNNNICKNINVELDSGMINIKTKDRNVDVNAQLDSGICTVDGERRINAGVNKTLGSGEGRVGIKLDSGTIKFSSQE